MIEFLGLLAGSGIIAVIWRYLRRPRLRVYFDPSRTGERRRTRVQGRQGVPGVTAAGRRVTTHPQAAWYHLQVENDGYRVATGCKAEIELLEHFVDGAWQRHPDFNAPIPLVWANTAAEREVDIHPKRSVRVDIGCALQGEGVFVFHTGMEPSGFIQALPAGCYKLVTTVLSSNAKPASESIILEYGGDWESVSILQHRT